MQDWVHAKVRASRPWLYALFDEADQHLNTAVIPGLESRFGRQPRWAVMGLQAVSHDLCHRGMLLTPILAVGTELAGGQPMPLIGSELSVFNHIPAETITFDASAFDAGLALARRP